MTQASVIQENRLINGGWAQILLIFVGCVLWFPTIDYQPPMVLGDMGRDLYAYQMTYWGYWPGRDFLYHYSPLMPLYYSGWFHLTGLHLVSMRIALGMILLICSLLTFNTLRLFVSIPVAFLASLAYWSLDILHTFNHIGAFPFMLLSIFAVWKFFLTRQIRWCYLGALALAGVSLIKVTVGACAFLAFASSLLLDAWLLKRERPGTSLRIFNLKDFFIFSGVISAVVLSVFVPLYWGLPLDWIRQCTTVRLSYYSLWAKLVHIPLGIFVWDERRLRAVLSFLMLAVFAFWGLKKKGVAEDERRMMVRVGGSLLLFGIANSSDYFLMEGYLHRLDFWLFPISVLLMGLLAEWAQFLLGRSMKTVAGFLFLLLLIGSPVQNIRDAWASRTPDRFLDFPNGRAYLGGTLSEVSTLKQATHFILQNTRPDQMLLVIPYEPIYCFLSGRRHALWEIYMSKIAHFGKSQETNMIHRLRRQRSPLMLVSNRIYSKEPSIGRFGQTYLTKFAQYVFANYEETVTFGPWIEDSAYPPAVKVFRLKTR